MNEQFLNHKTLTDIITFDNSEGDSLISGDIYISVDRVLENSVKYSASFNDEVHRVMVHGVLHLMGYGDKNPKQKMQMREKEDAYLSLRAF
jgi:rRNA maturation RNase YbeY